MPRNTLYKNLQDNEHVTAYPPVRGVAHNLFFIDHSHPEHGGGDDVVSKYNEYEVYRLIDMLRLSLTVCTKDSNDETHSPAPPAVRCLNFHSSIVSHTPSQGVYAKPKSIVVLCMYLGQLSKLREAFASSRVTVTLDSRDQEALMDREGDKDGASDSVVVQDVQLHRQVRFL